MFNRKRVKQWKEMQCLKCFRPIACLVYLQVLSERCPFYNVHIVQCEIYNVPYILYSLQFIVCNLQCTVYSIQCRVFTVVFWWSPGLRYLWSTDYIVTNWSTGQIRSSSHNVRVLSFIVCCCYLPNDSPRSAKEVPGEQSCLSLALRSHDQNN